MGQCAHERTELHDRREEHMHCQAWGCSSCDHLAIGECHHQSWCRPDFCGAEPQLLDPIKPPAAVA